MKSNTNETDRLASRVRWAGLLTGGAMACMIVLGTHVYVMSALKVSAHLLSIRLERATGCDRYERVMDAAGQGAQSALEAYIHVCIGTSGPTAHRSYVFKLDLQDVPGGVP
jgi:hypothetical protein